MNKVKIRREENQVIVERTYEIVPDWTVHFENRPKVDFSVIKGYIIRALKARMEHCLQQLDVEILPSEDKVVNEMGIFSPSKGIYFSQKSFESMESALQKIEEASLSENMLLDFDLIEIDQITKALIAFREPLPLSEAHYLSGWIMEALMVSAREQFSK